MYFIFELKHYDRLIITEEVGACFREIIPILTPFPKKKKYFPDYATVLVNLKRIVPHSL